MTVKGIHHVGLVVTDLEAAIAFYGELLGMQVTSRDEWSSPSPDLDSALGLVGSAARGVMLAGSTSYMELWEYEKPSPQQSHRVGELGANEAGLRHLALEVDNVEETLGRVQELGGAAMGRPLQISGSNVTVVYCRDPFGTILELVSSGGDMPRLEDL